MKADIAVLVREEVNQILRERLQVLTNDDMGERSCLFQGDDRGKLKKEFPKLVS